MSELSFTVGESTVKTICHKDGDKLAVKVGANEYSFQPLGDNLFQLHHNGSSHIVAIVKHKDIYYIDIDSTVIEVRDSGASQNNVSASSGSAVKDKVFAPMPGKIVKIMVTKGDRVTAKQPLAVVEAMKMENQITSPANGKVKAINFTVGDQVNTTTAIIELDLAD